ncbi:hypothetical protein ACJX0J_017993 [Zea mays]
MLLICLTHHLLFFWIQHEHNFEFFLFFGSINMKFSLFHFTNHLYQMSIVSFCHTSCLTISAHVIELRTLNLGLFLHMCNSPKLLYKNMMMDYHMKVDNKIPISGPSVDPCFNNNKFLPNRYYISNLYL